MWDYWFEAIVLFMLFGISGRIWFLARHLDEVHDCLHNLEDRIFNEDDEIQVQDGQGNVRIMGLEQFMEEFGFDPREQEPQNAEIDEANKKAIDEWDNAKL